MQPSADASAADVPVESRTGVVRTGVVPPPRSAPDAEPGPPPAPTHDAPALDAPAGSDPAGSDPTRNDPTLNAPALDAPALSERSEELVRGGPLDEPVVSEAQRVELSERERAILAFEQHWWRHAGAKEQTIRDTFGFSSTRYYQLLNALIDNPAALAAEPVLVGRLRRLRASRARNRRR